MVIGFPVHAVGWIDSVQPVNDIFLRQENTVAGPDALHVGATDADSGCVRQRG